MLEQRIKALESSVAIMDSLKAKIKLNTSFLEILFDAIPSPIFYKDKDGIYINCNDAFSKNILGIPKDEIIGKSLYDFPKRIPKENADIYYKKDNELLQSHGTQTYKSEVKCSDGVTRYYNFYKATFMSESNEALGIIGIMMDITDIHNQEEKLKYLASTDSMTNLFNRRYLTESSESLCCLAKRNKSDISIIMLDIDNFKNINDMHGHKMGDEVIILLAQLLKKHSRKSDIVCRWGGEEFVMLLPDTNLEGGLRISQKIRKLVENLVINLEDNQELKYTVSIGVSQINCKTDFNIDSSIDRADKALYKAKASGRNKVCYI